MSSMINMTHERFLVWIVIAGFQSQWASPANGSQGKNPTIMHMQVVQCIKLGFGDDEGINSFL